MQTNKLFCLALLLCGTTQAALNDTGVTTCSNATEDNLPCPVADFPRQDAEYGTNAFNFTKIDADGTALPATATDHTCVWDNTTGLIWEVKTADGGLRDMNWTYSWYNSTANIGTENGGTCHAAGRCDTEKFVSDVNAAGLCGFTDWRLPNVKELIDIIDYKKFASYDTNYFPNMLIGGRYWSSSLIGPSAWSVQEGLTAYSVTTPKFFVRLVRGAEAVAAFTDNGNGTVTDSSTGLMWAKCAEGKSGDDCAIGSETDLNWSAALTAGQKSRLAGYNDWRLPNIKELLSLGDYVHYGPNIYQDYFPNTRRGGFVSSTVVMGSTLAMGVNLDVGGTSPRDRDTNSFARLVRTNGPLTNAMNGHTYQFNSTFVDWNTAKTNCAALDGYLATITSEQEQDWIVNKFGTDTQIWLGGTDEGHEGTWTWVTGEPWDYTNWNPGEPNGVESENCTHIEGDVDDRWNDLACSANMRYLCEWNLPTDGLVAYYPFNGNANDASGNANNGTVYGATLTADRFGRANSAYNFDGISNYISVPSSTSLNPVKQLTMAFWIKVLGTPNTWSPILYKGGVETDGLANREYTIWLNNTLYFHQNSAGDGAGEYWLDSPTVTNETWVHYVGIIDRVNHVMQIYLNGQKVAENSDPYSSFNNNEHELRMGGTEEVGSSIFFQGILDDVRLYNRDLSADEITQLYTLGATTLALNITKAGTGSGTVTSAPAGINCGEDCTENYVQGTVVNLTATPQTIMCVTTPCPRHIFVGWSGDADCSDGKVTMNAVKNCTATFNIQTHIVTPITAPAIGGTVTPNTPQTVNNTETKAFTVTPAAAYTKNATVSGTCPQGSWNGNVWTTGVIIENCTVIFGFTLKTYTVTPSAGTGGTVTPNASQTVNHGVIKQFTLTPNSGYAKNTTVTGTCPPGSWNGNVWTTGAIVTNCTVNFSFVLTSANSWLYPITLNLPRDKQFTLNITAKSDGMYVANYEYVITFDPTKLSLVYNQCDNGVCLGANALNTNSVFLSGNNSIRVIGLGGQTVAGNDLQLLSIHFKSKTVLGSTNVGLTTIKLVNTSGDNIGLSARGAIVNVSPGICGDANGDTKVNIIDALAIARKLVTLPPPPTIEPLWADVNKDNNATIIDALHIARYSIGLVLPPEVCNIGQPL